MLHDYLRHHFNRIEGWCYKYNWMPLAYIDSEQRRMGRSGPIAEIGVFHGKFFLGLVALKHDSLGHLAIDVFDKQEFNLAGNGTPIRIPEEVRVSLRTAFETNVRKSGVRSNTVNILQADSLSLDKHFLLREVSDLQRFSFFSVDGCHEFTHAYNDIQIALSLVDSAGIVLVDDYYNADWPGVHEAVAKMYFSGAPNFVPLYYIYNKLALCHVNFHSLYLEGLFKHLRETYAGLPVRRVKRYGWESLSISPREGINLLPDFPADQLL